MKVTIPGKPRGQGSMSLWRAADGSERAKYAPEVVAHRNLVVGTFRDAHDGPPIMGAFAVRIEATFARPKSHYGTGRNAQVLKANAPDWHTGYPDADKIARLIDDALTIAGVIGDDSQVALLRVEKRYGERNETTVEVVQL